jgi:lysophospholipase L1-like esterase
MAEVQKRYATFRSALAWSGLAALFFVTMELAARLDDHLTFGAPLSGRYDMEQLFQPTPRGVRGVPNGRCMKWSLNSLGFRGTELQRFADQVRVVTYGASETFGIYEDVGREYPRALERVLNASDVGQRFEVINAGMPGMRVGSGVQLLRDIGASLHPDVVIVYPTPTHYIGVTRPYCERTVSARANSSPGFKARMGEKLKDRLKAALPRNGLTLMRKAGIWWDTRGEAVVDRVDRASLDAFEHDLRCALGAIREAGAVPVLVTHANRFGAIRHPDDAYWLTGWRGQYPEMREGGFIDLENRANERIRATARGEKVILVDAAAALSGVPESFADHAHFTNEGADRLGRLLADAVRETSASHPSAAADVRTTVLPR